MSVFYFVRHGQSEANAAGIIADETPALTMQGVEQARSVGMALQDKGIKAVVCSPYLRARQTAQIIADQLGLTADHIIVINELRERGLGDKEGGPKDEASDWYFEADNTHGIEPRLDVLERMYRCVTGIELIMTKLNGPVVVVGHAVSGFYLLQAAKGITIPELMDKPSELGNAEFMTVNL